MIWLYINYIWQYINILTERFITVIILLIFIFKRESLSSPSSKIWSRKAVSIITLIKKLNFLFDTFMSTVLTLWVLRFAYEDWPFFKAFVNKDLKFWL